VRPQHLFSVAHPSEVPTQFYRVSPKPDCSTLPLRVSRRSQTGRITRR